VYLPRTQSEGSFSVLFFGTLLRALQCIPVARGDGDSRKAAMRAMLKRCVLLYNDEQASKKTRFFSRPSFACELTSREVGRHFQRGTICPARLTVYTVCAAQPGY
jgi:hypothetical protein